MLLDGNVRKVSIITGWANYHQSVVSSEIFNKLDARIWNMLWHWAKRRHPMKTKYWIANKYWHESKNRSWVFLTGDKQLKFLSSTKIVRHKRLKLDKNPYLDNDYFVLRKSELGIKKRTGMTKNAWDIAKSVCKPETVTMINNCCPI
jgi:RNA-directed DNA polymerase